MHLDYLRESGQLKGRVGRIWNSSRRRRKGYSNRSRQGQDPHSGSTGVTSLASACWSPCGIRRHSCNRVPAARRETTNRLAASPYLPVSKLQNPRIEPPTEKFAIRYAQAHFLAEYFPRLTLQKLICLVIASRICLTSTGWVANLCRVLDWANEPCSFSSTEVGCLSTVMVG